MSRALVQGVEVVGKCNGSGKTCGPVALFGVLLMFGLLAGGVFMLLQSNFGMLQGYLIAGTAFWASWFVLTIIWFTGVPGIPLSSLPGITKDIPRSTPRFYGPQGKAPIWLPLSAQEQSRLADSPRFIPASGTQLKSDQDSLKAAETAAAETMAAHYAGLLGTDPKRITVPGTVLVDEPSTEIIRSGGGIKYIKFASKAATAGPTATDDERANIPKIKAAIFIFRLDRGTVALQTYIALPLTFLLFLVHLLGLMWYERRHRPVSAAERQRERETAGV